MADFKTFCTQAIHSVDSNASVQVSEGGVETGFNAKTYMQICEKMQSVGVVVRRDGERLILMPHSDSSFCNAQPAKTESQEDSDGSWATGIFSGKKPKQQPKPAHYINWQAVRKMYPTMRALVEAQDPWAQLKEIEALNHYKVTVDLESTQRNIEFYAKHLFPLAELDIEVCKLLPMAIAFSVEEKQVIKALYEELSREYPEAGLSLSGSYNLWQVKNYETMDEASINKMISKIHAAGPWTLYGNFQMIDISSRGLPNLWCVNWLNEPYIEKSTGLPVASIRQGIIGMLDEEPRLCLALGHALGEMKKTAGGEEYLKLLDKGKSQARRFNDEEIIHFLSALQGYLKNYCNNNEKVKHVISVFRHCYRCFSSRNEERIERSRSARLAEISRQSDGKPVEKEIIEAGSLAQYATPAQTRKCIEAAGNIPLSVEEQRFLDEVEVRLQNIAQGIRVLKTAPRLWFVLAAGEAVKNAIYNFLDGQQRPQGLFYERYVDEDNVGIYWYTAQSEDITGDAEDSILNEFTQEVTNSIDSTGLQDRLVQALMLDLAPRWSNRDVIIAELSGYIGQLALIQQSFTQLSLSSDFMTARQAFEARYFRSYQNLKQSIMDAIDKDGKNTSIVYAAMFNALKVVERKAKQK